MDQQVFRDAGRYVLARPMRHKIAALIVALFVGYLFWPTSTPKLRGIEPPKEQPNQAVAATPSPSTSSATTQPASTQPVTAQRAADLPLYAPDQDGADPSWSLPAELKADDLQ